MPTNDYNWIEIITWIHTIINTTKESCSHTTWESHYGIVANVVNLVIDTKSVV